MIALKMIKPPLIGAGTPCLLEKLVVDVVWAVDFDSIASHEQHNLRELVTHKSALSVKIRKTHTQEIVERLEQGKVRMR